MAKPGLDASAGIDDRPTMLFVRDYRRFSGGHLKYCHHLGHIAAHGRFRPLLHVTSESKSEELDRMVPADIERVALPRRCDSIFVAGTDWQILDSCGQDTSACPVLNLIQGVRHADPALPLYDYLKRPAVRICVSREVAEAIANTGQVNGPIHVVENGLDHVELAKHRQMVRRPGCLVAGLKAPVLAQRIGQELASRGIAHEILIDHLPRDAYLSCLAGFEYAILLPLPAEGFYLPALEAMALGVAVIMPDCVGARSFAIDGRTCLVAPRNASAIADAAARVMSSGDLSRRLREEGCLMSRTYDIAAERRKLLAIIEECSP